MNKFRVMLSCDDNSFYYNFWNDVSYVWNKIFNFTPTLIYISDNENKSLSNKNGEIIRVNKVKNIPVHLQAQLARVYYSTFFSDDICILSDIDMLPISKSFFDKNNILKNLNNNHFYHLNPTSREFGQLPMCYYCGKGFSYNEFTNFNSWEHFLNNVVSYDFNAAKLGYILPDRLKNNQLWFSDELFLFTKIKENSLKVKKNDKTIKINERLDREQLINISMNNISSYIDCHMPRPFELYEKQIIYLINNLDEND